MLAYRDFSGAQELFVRAIQADPHAQRISDNLNELLYRFRGVDPEAGIDAYSVVQDFQRSQCLSEDDKKNAHFASLLALPGADAAALKLQMCFRKRSTNAHLRSLHDRARLVSGKAAELVDQVLWR
jgi:hypothetical protein